MQPRWSHAYMHEMTLIWHIKAKTKKSTKIHTKVTLSLTRIHHGSRLDNQSQRSQIILSVWRNSSSVVKNSDSHIHSHLSGCRWGPHPLISSCLDTFSCGAASYSEWQPWQTWGSTSSNAETFKLDKLFQQAYIKQAYSRNYTGIIIIGWITQIEFILRGPADAVVLKKLLQQFFLIEELQTLHSTKNAKKLLFSDDTTKTP